LGSPRKPSQDGQPAKKRVDDLQKNITFAASVARRKFRGEIAAGITELRKYPAGYANGSGTLLRRKANDRLTETVIPMFVSEGVKDKEGSESQKRFLAVEKIMGQFDTDVTEQ
jgi:hypothetical protein